MYYELIELHHSYVTQHIHDVIKDIQIDQNIFICHIEYFIEKIIFL